jgi:hypothetical protein
MIDADSNLGDYSAIRSFALPAIPAPGRGEGAGLRRRRQGRLQDDLSHRQSQLQDPGDALSRGVTFRVTKAGCIALNHVKTVRPV